MRSPITINFGLHLDNALVSDRFIIFEHNSPFPPGQDQASLYQRLSQAPEDILIGISFTQIELNSTCITDDDRCDLD